MRVIIERIFADYDPWLLVPTLTAAMFATWGAGWWLGCRTRTHHDVRSVSKFDDASLALVGLLLAFSFGMSFDKHERRREMVIADSNSIGDFYTCASLLKEPIRGQLQAAIREYLELRVEFVRQGMSPASLDVAIQRSQRMQATMTDLVSQALNNGTPIAVSLTNTLNALTSNHAARLAAARDRLPSSIVMLLFVAAVMSTMLVGREQGMAGRPEISGTVVFILLLTLTVYVTLDLNRPQSGMIVVDQTPMQQLLLSLDK